MNKPKYEIGDRLPKTNIFIRGIVNLSNGKQRYFLQAGDNTFVFEADEIEPSAVAHSPSKLKA